MNIHEYQAKEVLARYGVPVPKGIPVDTPDQAQKAFTDLGGGLAVVKAQIHAGGRGKAGGVKLVRSADEAKKVAQGLLGKALVTPQTGPEGRVVKKLYVTAGADIAREMYLAVAMDRAARAPVVIAAAEGGVEIEQLAHDKPDALLRVPVHPIKGILPFQVRRRSFPARSTFKRRDVLRWDSTNSWRRTTPLGERRLTRSTRSLLTRIGRWTTLR